MLRRSPIRARAKRSTRLASRNRFADCSLGWIGGCGHARLAPGSCSAAELSSQVKSSWADWARERATSLRERRPAQLGYDTEFSTRLRNPIAPIYIRIERTQSKRASDLFGALSLRHNRSYLLIDSAAKQKKDEGTTRMTLHARDRTRCRRLQVISFEPLLSSLSPQLPFEIFNSSAR